MEALTITLSSFATVVGRTDSLVFSALGPGTGAEMLRTVFFASIELVISLSPFFEGQQVLKHLQQVSTLVPSMGHALAYKDKDNK